jgi:type II secretion system protein D
VRKILAYLAKSLVVCNCSLVALAQGLPQGASSRTGAVSIQVENDSPQLQVYDLPPDIVGAVTARLSLDFAQNPRVRVTTEPKTGRLMVMAPNSVQAQIANKMQQLRQEAMQLGLNRFGGVRPDAYTQNSYTLQNLTWREFEDAIRTVIGPKATINTERNGELAQFRVASPSGLQDILQVDRRLNQVNMQGSIPSVAAWMQVVQALDQSHIAGNEPTHILPLAPAEPAKVERALRLVSFAAQQQQNNQQEEEEATAVIGQPNRNNQQPGNQQPGSQQPGNVQDEQAAAIGSVDSLGANSGLFGNVQIEFVNELGVVIVRGNKRDVQRVLEVIDQIKQQSVETQPEIEIYMLKNADSIALGTLVRELYTQVLAPRQGTVSITSLGQPNALLLIGRREAIGGLTELLDKLDQPLDPSSQLRVFRLLNASAVDAETTVRNFFVERPGNDENPRTGLGVRVKVTADYRTNSLIVQASPRDMTEVAKLIEEIDVESTDAQNEMRVFSLKNSIAEDLEPVLQAAISGQAANQQGQQGGGGTARATPLSSKLSIVTTEGQSGEQIDSGILAGVVVTANPANNTIVVRAPSKSMPLIAALIEQLDQLPGAEASIKVFTVKNGDATSLATVVQQLFGLPVTAGTGNTGGLFGGNNQLSNLGGSTGGDSSLVPLRVSVDTRTNSIIASGSASDLEVIEVLLLRLDEEGVSNRITEVIWLRNAAAADVATALNNYLTTQRQIVQQTLLFNQSITRTEQFDREIIVVPEAATNSLVISASPKYYETIRSVIDSLDRRPPMVMVQVLIAEVSLDDGFEWGAELGLQDAFLYDRGVVTEGAVDPGFDFIGNPLGNSATGANRANIGRQGTTSFGVGQAGTFGYGGLVLSAASESVNFLLRTLHDARRLQVLSRPQIMTLDGQPARILVGQSVPRVTGANNNGVNGGFTTTTTDEDVGLIMDITPRVNQDGLIVMNVAVERSGLSSQQGIPIAVSDGETIFSPIINRTQADTVISAYNNQTVVFAGLITKQRETIARRVPYVSDIPILGLLFRSDIEVEKRSELLVVMTPHLVTDEEDLNIIKEVESSRMSWCLADVLEMHGDVGLNGGHGLWGPAASAMMYPEMQPGEISKTATDSIPVRPNNYPAPGTPVPTEGQVPEVLEGVPAEGAQEGSVIQSAPIDPASYYEQGPGMAAPVGYYPVQSGPMVQPAQMIQPYPMIPANPAMQPGQGTIRR